ncbi:glyoxalase family protein [Vibrio astriarenae]|nr:glyoxalase family protein [Vibrio sp. C7]
MNQHEKLNYVEFGANDLEATKSFFTRVFGWEFTDYGPDYTAFANQA